MTDHSDLRSLAFEDLSLFQKYFFLGQWEDQRETKGGVSYRGQQHICQRPQYGLKCGAARATSVYVPPHEHVQHGGWALLLIWCQPSHSPQEGSDTWASQLLHHTIKGVCWSSWPVGGFDNPWSYDLTSHCMGGWWQLLSFQLLGKWQIIAASWGGPTWESLTQYRSTGPGICVSGSAKQSGGLCINQECMAWWKSNIVTRACLDYCRLWLQSNEGVHGSVKPVRL